MLPKRNLEELTEVRPGREKRKVMQGDVKSLSGA